MTYFDVRVTAFEKLNNMVFPSKEDDGVEHVDSSHEEFMQFFLESMDAAYDEGRESFKKETLELLKGGTLTAHEKTHQ
jgi:hypothetical protein